MRLAAYLGALAIASASAALANDFAKQIDLVAHAVTSAQTCGQYGYKVDLDGVARFSAESRQAALQSGADPAEYDRMQADEIEREYKLLEARVRDVKYAPQGSDLRAKYHAFWTKRCQRLNRDAATGSLFTKTKG